MTIVIVIITLAFRAGIKTGANKERKRVKDAATQVERAYGGCVNDLAVEGLKY